MSDHHTDEEKELMRQEDSKLDAIAAYEADPPIKPFLSSFGVLMSSMATVPATITFMIFFLLLYLLILLSEKHMIRYHCFARDRKR